MISKPIPGQEDEFNRWHSTQHLDDVLQIPGFVAAQRFKLKMDAALSLPGPYLALYEMETDDPKAALDAMGRAADAGDIVISPALNTVDIVSSIFTPLTERKTGED